VNKLRNQLLLLVSPEIFMYSTCQLSVIIDIDI
jgi:hypothetical protein